MDELDNTEKNLPNEKSKNPNGSTGPTSPEGKAKSSLNRLTHGCRADTIVLPFENHAEWDFTLESWMKSYDPQEPTAASLVFEAARAHWVFQRNQKRLDVTESGLPPDPIHWTDHDHKQYSNFLRYKTTAERSFYRAFNNLETYYKRQSDKAAREERARAQMAKIQMQWLKEKAADAENNNCFRQRVEVITNDAGECITTFLPSNEEFANILASHTERQKEKYKYPPDLFVSRFIFFFNGVPAPYHWLDPNEVQRRENTFGIQQFTHEGWLKQIEAEKLGATEHPQPYETALLLY